MIALADDNVQMGLTRRLRVPDPFFDDVFGLFDELAMQVDRVGGDAPFSVVLAKDELGRLLVVRSHGCTVRLALFRKPMRQCAVAAVVGFPRLQRRVI